MFECLIAISAETQKIQSIKKVTVFMHDKPMGSSNKQEKNIVRFIINSLSGLLSIKLRFIINSQVYYQFHNIGHDLLLKTSLSGNLNLYFDANRLAVSQCQQCRPKELSLSPLYQNGKLLWSIFSSSFSGKNCSHRAHS